MEEEMKKELHDYDIARTIESHERNTGNTPDVTLAQTYDGGNLFETTLKAMLDRALFLSSTVIATIRVGYQEEAISGQLDSDPGSMVSASGTVTFSVDGQEISSSDVEVIALTI